MSKTDSYKKLPTFNPDYYHSWAFDVQSAFAERNCTPFLDVTNDTVDDPKATAEAETETEASPTEHATSLVQSFAFLNQCIPYEHNTRIRNCTTAAQIWQPLKEEYASQTREDELRLEGILTIGSTAVISVVKLKRQPHTPACHSADSLFEYADPVEYVFEVCTWCILLIVVPIPRPVSLLAPSFEYIPSWADFNFLRGDSL
jgi:hypothetical protein